MADDLHDACALLRALPYASEQADPKMHRAFIDDAMAALRVLGAFKVVRPPFRPNLLDDVVAVRRALFDLDDDCKARHAAKSTLHTGHTRVSIERYGDLPPQPREMFTWTGLRDGLLENIPHYSVDDIVPEQCAFARPIIREFKNATADFALSLLRSFAYRLGEAPNYFDPMMAEGSCIYRALRYPPYKSPVGAPRVVAHRDFSFLTFLTCIDEPGLELALRERRIWLPINLRPGEVLVISGEMLEFVTNGAFRAGLHRVSGVRGADLDRRAMAAFFAGNDKSILTPMADDLLNDYLVEDPTYSLMSPLGFFRTRNARFKYQALTAAFDAWPVATSLAADCL